MIHRGEEGHPPVADDRTLGFDDEELVAVRLEATRMLSDPVGGESAFALGRQSPGVGEVPAYS